MEPKIAILGHQNITRYVSEYFLKNKISIDTLIGMKDPSKNKISDFFDVQEFCKAKNINYFQPDVYSLKSKNCEDFFQQKKFDYMFVVGWSRLVPEKIIKKIEKICVGWHGGMFKPPRCRGRAVVNWALIEGKKKFYVYTMSLKPGVDNGDILQISHTFLNEFDNSKTAYFKMSIKVAEMYSELLDQNKNFKPIPQRNHNATYLPKRTEANSGISWDKSCKELYDFSRALSDPYPNSFTTHKQLKIFIKQMIPFLKIKVQKKDLGKVKHVFSDESFTVYCRDGLMLVTEYESNSFFPYEGLLFNLSSGEQMESPKY